MSTVEESKAADRDGSGVVALPLGPISLIGGVCAVIGVAFIWLVSTTSFTPGNAIVIPIAFLGLAGWLVSLAAGALSLKTSGKTLGLVGLVLGIGTLVTFIVLINMMEY